MKIEADYLHIIFEEDQLYIVEEDQAKQNTEMLREDSEAQTVVAEPKPEPLIVPVKPVVKETQKAVMVLVDKDFSKPEEETLQKLMTAIQVSEGQYEIIKSHPQNLKEMSGLKLFLSFHPEYVKSDQYEILEFHTSKVIYAHSLQALNSDPKKKLMLWNLLKTIIS